MAAWSPWTETDMKTLEKVQERLVRLLSDAAGKDYEEKLRDAGLTSLKERRERGDAIEVFKELRRSGADEQERWFRLVDAEARPLRSNSEVMNEGEVRRKNVIEVEKAKLEVRRNFFVVRAAKTWNMLPDNVKEQQTVNGFKNAYDAWRWRRISNITNLGDAVGQTEGRQTRIE